MNFLNRCGTISSLCVLRRANQFSFGKWFQDTMPCVGNFHKHEKTLYPTHQVFTRGFGSSCIMRAMYTYSDIGDKNGKTVIKMSFMFICRRLYYMMFFDYNVKHLFGQSFTDGAKMAMLYITECLVDKNYGGLSTAVSPELLNLLKTSKVYKEYRDVERVHHMKLVYMTWECDQFTKEKNLEVDVAFTYFLSPDAEKTSILSRVIVAVFRFHRTYGDNWSDSQWTVTKIDFPFSMLENKIRRGWKK